MNNEREREREIPNTAMGDRTCERIDERKANAV